jgi:hypothetical protein
MRLAAILRLREVSSLGAADHWITLDGRIAEWLHDHMFD